LQPDLTILSSGWSRDLSQQRTYIFSQSGLSVDDLRTLKVAWTFGFEDANQPRSLPAVTDQAIFIESQEGAVFALDTNSGCGFCKFQTSASIRAAVTVAMVTQSNGDEIPVIFVANDDATVYAINAVNGRKLWEKRVETHKHAVITGSPVYYAGNIFIPISSKEVGIAVNPWGGCCTFRGSLFSLDAVSGKESWRTYTVKEPATFVERNALGGKQYGPAGAAIWSAPTIDTKRRLIYIGTGQDYSLPMTELSNAILAIDIETGRLVWKRKLGKDGLLGGVHWGMAADMRSVYVPISDASVPLAGDELPYTRKPGLNRLDLRTGEVIWSSSASELSSDKEASKVHFSAAITGIPGAIFAPGLNGILYAFSKEQGEVVWKFDSTVETQTANGLKAHGGAMDAGGVVAANGMLFFNSGYAGPASSFGEGGNLFWVLKKSDTF
jgi:outer membrane protein assembly factor BamB